METKKDTKARIADCAEIVGAYMKDVRDEVRKLAAGRGYEGKIMLEIDCDPLANVPYSLSLDKDAFEELSRACGATTSPIYVNSRSRYFTVEGVRVVCYALNADGKEGAK